MRTTAIYAAAALLSCVGVTTLRAGEHDSLPRAVPAGYGTMNVYAAGACAAPGYGTQSVQPGCCEGRSSCCDDVWAGYCQEKQQGISLPCIRPFARRCVVRPAAGCSDCNVSGPVGPMPAANSKIESAPEPAPQLPPPPSPDDQTQPAPAESQSVSKTKNVGPRFDPSAWNIGTAPK